MINLTQEEWEEKVSSDREAVIIDVRTREECECGMLENAVCLNLFDRAGFVAEVEQMDKSKHYYLYCRSGQRSAGACRLMEEMGIENTFNLLGGIINWKGELIKP